MTAVFASYLQIKLRTTNLLERLNRELKRRSDVIQVFQILNLSCGSWARLRWRSTIVTWLETAYTQKRRWISSVGCIPETETHCARAAGTDKGSIGKNDIMQV